MSTRRLWAWPLVPLYIASLRLKKLFQSAPKKLQRPIISVGSVSAGGAGKTPVVIALASMLKERGWHVDVLSRGYGRSGSGVELVEGNDACRFGDEPMLIAQRTGVPVWVGADRFGAGLRSEQGGTPRGVHLLDDGFQHRQLARAVDIVLVTAEDLEDTLLPAGNLREPLGALRRADVAVVREEEMERIETRLTPLLREGALIWTLRRTLRFSAPLFVFGAGLRPVAFCAIARPAGFAEMLLKAGCGVVDTIFFDDHHAYDMSDIKRIVQLATQLKATGFVTTEKDAVKLTVSMRVRLEAFGPVAVAALDAEFIFPERVARELEARLTQSASGA